MTLKFDDLIKFLQASEPTASGQIGVDLNTGRFRMLIDGSVRSFAHLGDVILGSGVSFLGSFTANDATFPSGSPAAATSRNQHPILAFDDTTAESVIFHDVMSNDYSNGNITINTDWMAATATSGDVTWGVKIERIAPGGTSIDSDSFQTQQIAAGTANASSGVITRTSIVLTQVQADGIMAGDAYRLSLQCVAPSGTLIGDAQVLRVSLEQ